MGVAKRMDIEEEELREPEDPSSEDPESYKPKKRKSQFEKTAEMIALVKRHLERTGDDGAMVFIESLENGLLKYGSLTEKQMNALKKFHKNASRVPF